MKHSTSTTFVLLSLLAIAPSSLSYDPGTLPQVQLPPCFQELVNAAIKFYQVSVGLAKVCTNVPAGYTEYDSQKSNLLQATTVLKTALENVIPCLEDIVSKQPTLAKVWEFGKKSLQDAVTKLNSLIEEINKSANITDLCTCFRNALKNIMDTMKKVITDLLELVPSYVKDLVTGILQMSASFTKGDSPSSDLAELQKNLATAFEKIGSGLNGLKTALTDYAATNTMLAIVLKMVVDELDVLIQITTDAAANVKLAKTVAELQQVVQNYFKKVMEDFQKIFSKLPFGK